jgi:hypothetical protein
MRAQLLDSLSIVGVLSAAERHVLTIGDTKEEPREARFYTSVNVTAANSP